MTNHQTSGELPGGTGVEPIAIIGMAARVPGANDVNEFWRNLIDGVESITFYSREEQLALGVTEDEMDDPSWVSAAPVIDKMEYFDADLFGMSEREAVLANPQHRLFLEAAHTALEDSGYDSARYPSSVGVYAGTGADHYQWTNLYRNAKFWQTNAGNLGVSTSNSPDYVATLVSYKLNLRGPSMTVHTACSTSLVAVHLAVEALRNAECDMALTGGVCVELPYGRGYQGLEGYTSPDGHCRPFDARANGTLWGSGVGVVVLKRLSDALADGDHVRGVILGNAINNDGSDKVGFSAPSIAGQTECVAQALAVAGVDPRTVGYVEAHGTGTALGDPIEVAALSAAYGQGATDRQWCALGSVKSNFGHLSQAAGVVGLIKAVLVLEHGLVPPTINFETVNPALDLEDSPFQIATTLSKWSANGTNGVPRRAAVSSFGIGGTNAHLVLQEAPEPATTQPAGLGSGHPAHLLRVSAHDPAALTAAVDRLAGHLERSPAIDLADVAHTLRLGRAEHAHRAVVVAADPESAAEALRDQRALRTGEIADVAPRVAFLFSGQGAQYAGMGAELYDAEPAFAAAVDECAELLAPALGDDTNDIRTLLFASGADRKEADERLRQTRYTQPALFVLEYALAALWRDCGVEPAAMIGHSVGEYVAATLAGTFALPDALRLVTTRATLMQSMPSGAMLAVQLDEAEVTPLLDGTGCAIATVNAPGTCVVAGSSEAVTTFSEELGTRGINGKLLRTSHAFHSPMMEPILDEFAAAVAAVPRQAPRIPFASNVTGEWITDEQATDPEYWARHLRQPVRFGAGVATLLADTGGGKGQWAFVECGPGRQLAGLTRKQMSREALAPVHSLPGGSERAGDVTTFCAAAGHLWLAGVEVGAVGPAGHRVPLPTYPYQRKRYWVDPDPDYSRSSAPVAPRRRGPLPLADWFAVPTWRQLPPRAQPVAAEGECLVFTAGERGAQLAEALRAAGHPVTEVGPDRLSGPADYGALVASGVPARIVHAWALDAEPARVDDIAAAWRAQEAGFFSLLSLAQALAGRDAADDVHLDVLSAGTEDVSGTDATRPEQATLDGIGRVLPLELPWLTVRRIDAPDTPAAELAAELRAGWAGGADPAELEEPGRTLALRAGRRWVTEYREHRLSEVDATPLRERGRYLITGGLGGVGITVAEDLAVRHKARLVLLSRSGLPPRAEWDTQLAVHGENDRTGRAIAAIRRMEAAGGQVRVLAADVTDPAALRRIRDDVLAEWDGLDGIVHSAGLPGGGVAEVKDRALAEAVLAPKLAGTFALQSAFGDLPLDFVSLYSSVTGVAGGFGQLDYCAANAFLDAYARGGSTVHGWSCPVRSLNWGGWLEVGMAAETTQESVAAVTSAPEPPVPMEHPVLTARTSTACWGVVTPESHWLLDEHRIAGVGVVPGTGHLECVRAAFAACHPAPVAGAAVQLSDVAFLEPFSVPDGAAAEYRVEFDGPRFSVRSVRGGVRREHVRGTAEWVTPAPEATVDISAVRASCRPVAVEDGNAFRSGGRVSMLTFGPRWAALRDVYVGDGEELAVIEASEAAMADLDRWALHPSLLDVATSFGSRGEGSYLPLSYGRVVVRRPLPARFHSHLRHTDDGTENNTVLTADLTLVDDTGVELVAINDFVLRKVDTSAVSENVSGAGQEQADESGGEAERGIRPADGVEAFRRALAAPVGPQVIIYPEPVAELLDRGQKSTVDDLVVGEEEELTSRRPATPESNGAPTTELEATIAKIWAEVLGVERVGVDDDFFDLGGNSLVAVQLIAHLRKAVGVRLPMKSLFEQPTVAGLAAWAEQLRAKAGDKAKPEDATPKRTIPRLAQRSS